MSRHLDQTPYGFFTLLDFPTGPLRYSASTAASANLHATQVGTFLVHSPEPIESRQPSLTFLHRAYPFHNDALSHLAILIIRIHKSILSLQLIA